MVEWTEQGAHPHLTQGMSCGIPPDLVVLYTPYRESIQPGTLLYQCSETVVRPSGSQLRKPGFEPCVIGSKYGQVCSLCCFSPFSCIDEYLAIESGGYLCTNSICALVAV